SANCATCRTNYFPNRTTRSSPTIIMLVGCSPEMRADQLRICCTAKTERKCELIGSVERVRSPAFLGAQASLPADLNRRSMLWPSRQGCLRSQEGRTTNSFEGEFS